MTHDRASIDRVDATFLATSDVIDSMTDRAHDGGSGHTAAARQEQHAMPIVTTDDHTTLDATDWGVGPTLVFCHSWALNQDQFDYLTARLVAAGVRCITFDRRYHGRSQRSGPLTLDRFADDLHAVMVDRDLTDVTLVGHSFGCAEVTRYLTRHGRARVARVVMLAPMLPYMTQAPDNPDGVPMDYIDASLHRLAADVGGWCEDNRDPFFGADQRVSESKKDWVSRQIQATPVSVLVDVMRIGATTDLRDEVAAITVPTLVVQGDMDASTPLELTGRRVAAMVAGARLVVLPGVGHGLYASETDRIVEEICAFMA
jgi:non-heme chloroperoxidase